MEPVEPRSAIECVISQSSQINGSDDQPDQRGGKDHAVKAIQHAAMSRQQPSVVFDTVLALDGGESGLEFYRRIIKDSNYHLKTEGMIFFEIGFDQAEDVSKLLEENGFKDIVVKKDLAMNDRVIYAKKG